MSRLVFFHPKLNLPSLGGGDVHTHEILKCLKQLGFKIYLYLLETENRPILTRENWGYEEVKIIRDQKDKQLIFDDLNHYIQKVNPQAIWVNYPSWGDILDFKLHRHRLKILYNHHFESVRQQMASIYYDLWNRNVPKSIEKMHPKLYDVGLYQGTSFHAEDWEYEIYDQYDLVYAIDDFGAPLIKKKCTKAKVYSFPVTLSFQESEMKYEKIALYTMSPYSFHFQGYYFFIKCVLPLITKEDPFFRVHLTGLGSEYFLPSPHVICKRFLSNIEEEYQKARLLLCPSFSGTGQQVKIVEAMNYGLPVVSMKNPYQFNPIENGQTGYVVDTAKDFAKAVLSLMNNAPLAKKMGQKAKDTIRKKYSHDVLIQQLLHIKSFLNNKEHKFLY